MDRFKLAQAGLLFLFLITAAPVFSQSTFETSEPVKIPTEDEIRLVDNRTYCIGGFGAQDYVIAPGDDGKTFRSRGEQVTYRPDVENTSHLTFGCSYARFFLNYSLSEIALRLDETFPFRHKTYNTVDLNYQAFVAGYSIPLWKHLLYLDVGLGYGVSQFVFKLDDDSGRATDTLKETNWFWTTGLKLFASPYIALQWKLEIVPDGGHLVRETNTMILHFYTKLD